MDIERAIFAITHFHPIGEGNLLLNFRAVFLGEKMTILQGHLLNCPISVEARLPPAPSRASRTLFFQVPLKVIVEVAIR